MISDGPSITLLADFVNGFAFKSEHFEDEGLPVIRIKQLLNSKVEVDRTTLDVPVVRIDNGDIIFSWSASLAVRVWDRGPALLNQHLFRVDPKPGVHSVWLAYVLVNAVERLKALMHGSAMTHITRDMLKLVTVSLPSESEQRAIADFLDTETARIDALIEKKRRMIELSEERFAAHVEERTHVSAVSAQEGVPLLTDGWRSILLRRCFALIQYGIGEATRVEGTTAVLGMGNVDRGEIVGNVGGFVEEVDPSLLLEPGDLLFNRTNSLALVGKVALVRDDTFTAATTFASYLVRLRTNHLANNSYLNYLLNTRAILGQARSMALPSIGQANLNPSRYTSMHVPLPPVRVQCSIVKDLDQEADNRRKLSKSLTRQIELLTEHRQALITAAVTGQLEVPGTAAS